MKKNIGNVDKILRIIVGLVLVIFAFISGNVYAYIGVVPLLTALINICPLYTILGISTCRITQ